MFLSRRDVLKASALSAAAALSVPLSSLSTFAQSRPSDEKLLLSAPLTHSDWMLKPNMVWGMEGVRHMLDACKACGWSRVHWRVFDAGQASYPSKLLRPAEHPDLDNIFNPQTDEDRAAVKTLLPNLTPQQGAKYLKQFEQMDYGRFDSLAAAVEYGHSIGLQIHAWATINEDDHGWGWPSEFARAHPEYRWKRRDGRPYHSQMSFAFEEVRRYKLDLIRELLAYEIDGLFLDWIRTGDIRDNPQTDEKGVANSGYEQPNVDAFRKQFGMSPQDVPADDPRWVTVRCAPQTVFMRDARKLTKVPIAILVGHPWHYRGTGDKIDGNRRGLLLDVKQWANEGLMDAAVAAGYYRDGGNSELAHNALRNETDGKVDVWTYEWVPQSVDEFNRDAATAANVGAKQILFWEADYIDDRANAAELKRAMSAGART
jgi:hypothetical protein